jgi:hypothetical protein
MIIVKYARRLYVKMLTIAKQVVLSQAINGFVFRVTIPLLMKVDLEKKPAANKRFAAKLADGITISSCNTCSLQA